MKSQAWDAILTGAHIAAGIVVGLMVLAFFCAALFSLSGCTNAVLEGPDGATEDVGTPDVAVAIEPLWITITNINSNGGQPLNDSSCKLTYIRGYTMQFQGCNFSCSGDQCVCGSLVIDATACVDLTLPERRCELWKFDNGNGTRIGWFRYVTTCQHAPLPKASLMYKSLSDFNNNLPSQRVFNQPYNRLEVQVQ